jgi:hypothetical protein
VLAAILYVLGWVPAGETSRVASWIRKNSIPLFVAGAVLIVTRNPWAALLSGILSYPLAGQADKFTGGVPGSRMSAGEAYEVLGLRPGATVDEIKAAHRNLMKRSHPDQGGTAYLASKVNEAKEVLLKTGNA